MHDMGIAAISKTPNPCHGVVAIPVGALHL